MTETSLRLRMDRAHLNLWKAAAKRRRQTLSALVRWAVDSYIATEDVERRRRAMLPRRGLK